MVKKTLSKIKDFASRRDLELNELDGNGYWLVEGSTIVDITVSKLSDGDTVVTLLSRVVIDPRIDGDLLAKLLNLNAQLNFGAFGLIDNVITFKYSILGGENLDFNEFWNALSLVALIADEYDDKIVSTHGGKTSLRALEEAHQQRQQQQSILPW